MGLTAKLLGILVLAPPSPVPSASLPPAPDGRGQPGFSSSFFLVALPVNASIPRGPMAAPGEGVDGQPRCPHPCFPPRKPKTVLPSTVRGAGWQPGLFLNFPPPASAFSLQTKPCRLFFPLPLEPGLSSPSSWPQPWSKPLSFFTQTVTKTFSWFRPPWVLQDAGGERRMLTPPPFPPTVLHSAPKADDGLSLITHQRRAIWRSVLLCDLLSVFPVRGS